MSNYLNSLVVRQLDSDSLVQPRLSSLFEPSAFAPVPPRSLVAVDLRAADTAIASIEPVASINPLPTIEPLNNESIAEHVVAVPLEAGDPPEPTSGSRSSFFSSSGDDTPGPVWRGRQNIESIASLPPKLTSEQPDEGERQIRVPEIQLLTRETSPVPWRNSRKPLSALPGFEQEQKAHHQATAVRPIETTINETAIGDTNRGIESNKDPRIVRPRVGLPNELRKAGDNSVVPVAFPVSEPAPIINVTIGRIEVRATTPATSARKQPSPRPLMSLDEYLQRRTRGGGS